MKPRILLINPPIYDFAAYDFWLKPYGMLNAAGKLRGKADFELFDFLDRLHPFMTGRKELECDQWCRGRFYAQNIARPACLEDIPRYYRRFGLPVEIFEQFLTNSEPFDYVVIQTMMTYWYPGVREIITRIREFQPQAKIILGGVYVTLCTEHARRMGADLLVIADKLEPLWEFLGIEPDISQSALWELYDKLKVGVLKISDGCPFSCTYCSVPQVYGKFRPRPLEHSLSEYDLLISLGVENIAFYDDALLFEHQKYLKPFLTEVIKRKTEINLHTPNALNARFITNEIAELMVRAGFKTFYLGFESNSANWQKKTGAKVFSDELVSAVEALLSAGAAAENITAYQILGHPKVEIQQLESSMRFVNNLGIRGMLADFSPIPGTCDGELCRDIVDLDEPLMQNKTAFPIILMGYDESNRLKDIQRQLNRNLK